MARGLAVGHRSRTETTLTPGSAPLKSVPIRTYPSRAGGSSRRHDFIRDEAAANSYVRRVDRQSRSQALEKANARRRGCLTGDVSRVTTTHCMEPGGVRYLLPRRSVLVSISV